MSKKLELAMRIRAEMDQAQQQLRQLEKNIDDVGKRSQQTSRDMERIGSVLGKIGAAIAGGVLFKSVIAATVEQERVTAQLEQTLIATGNAAGLSKQQLLDMAAGLQDLTTYGDEAIIPAQSLLLTFKEIGAEVFPEALEMALDLSTAMGQSLSSSATMLGKALEDPVRGLNAMSRVGVSFTKEQEALIKSLVETGRTADAQRVILKVLEGQYGGSARAARNTLGGALAALKNAFGDLLEGDSGGDGVRGATSAINDLTNTLNDPAVKAGFQAVVSGILRITEVAATAISTLAGLSQWFGEELAARMHGPALDDLVRIEDAIERQQALVERLERRPQLRGGNAGPAADIEAERRKLAELQQLYRLGQSLAEDAARARQKASAEAAAGAQAEGAANAVLNGDAQKLLDTLKRQAETIGLVTEEAKTRYAIESGELGKLIPEHQELLLAEARRVDAVRAGQRAADEQRRTNQQLLADQISYVAGLERQSALIGLNTEQVRAYEIAEKGLTGTLRDRAEAAVALLAAEERRVQVAADAATLAGLEAQRLRAQGREAEALTIEIEQRYGELMTRLQERGDTAGLEIVNGLINIEQARARLNELQSVVDQVFSSTARQEQSVQAQLAAGLITEGEARRRIIELHQQQAAELMRILPMMEAVAEITGDPAALENVQRIRAELENMQYITNDLIRAFRDGLQGGIEDALMGLVRGTHDLRDALNSLVLGIADAMARLAAEQLADMATQSVLNLFQQSAQAATAAAGQKAAAEVAAINTVTAAQQAADTARAASSVAAANTAAAGQAGAAASTASAWTPAAIAASIGSFGSAAAIGLAAVVAAMAFQAFADGGHVRGAGTTTSDSIPAWLSDYEFVTRAAVVQQPGALPFLHDFNERGMAALDDWAGRVRHATGGLAGVPAPALPAPAMHSGQLAETGMGAGTTLHNRQNFYLVDDPNRIVDAAFNTRAGEEGLLVMLSKDPAKFRSVLGF